MQDTHDSEDFNLDEMINEASDSARRTVHGFLTVIRMLAGMRAPEKTAASAQAGLGTKKDFAARHKVSSPTVDRWVREGCPHGWAGTRKRFDAASDAWVSGERRAPKKTANEDRVDVSTIARKGGLRLAAGGK